MPFGVGANEFEGFTLESGKIYRFIAGRDAVPVVIPQDKGRELLFDPFAQGVLFSGNPLPLSLRSLISRLDQIGTGDPAALPLQRSFVVADGGQIQWTQETEALERDFRFVVTRQHDGASVPDLLISASTDLDSQTAFLQVIGWDAKSGAFQFYDRREGSWVWAGSSWDALEPDSRSHGPFDSHVNGALNMKELKLPWINWHSQSATILDNALAPTDPLRNESLWKGKSAAQDFERDVARAGIRRWTDSRFKRSVSSDAIAGLPKFLRQVLETTTVNLVSSPDANSALATAASVRLPITFFISADALFDSIGLSPDIEVPAVSAQLYRAMLARYEVRVGDGKFFFPGDTHFVFVIPEPAFEDVVVLEGLLALGVLDRKLAAALLMVDFCNPVFSPKRAALMRYVPETARVRSSEFTEQFVKSVKQSPQASVPDTAESDFLANWNLADQDWQGTFERHIEQYFQALQSQLKTASGFAPIFELAESRRREFRKRPLAEFRLTTPITNIPENAPFLQLTAGGGVQKK
jgi:hypothetical protein